MHTDALKKIPLFEDLSTTELERILAICKVETFAANDHVFEEGDAGDKLFLISKGQVRISKFVPGIGEEALAILEEGNFFGEMSLIDDSPRSATAIAHIPVELLSISSSEFESLLFLDKELAHQVLWAFTRTLSKRLRETNNKIKSFFAMSGGFS